METRANFFLIGLFTLCAILGTLGFFIWLAGVRIDRQYQSYGILFEDVSGLDPAGDVLFNGIPVGKVIALAIHQPDPSKVLATVEIDAATPVRRDTVAQLQSQGVTGVAYISLSGGTPGAPELTAADGGLPIIPSRRSTVQALVEDAPDLLSEASTLLAQIQSLTGPENQAYVSNILRNLDASSGRLDEALGAVSEITATLRDATGQITRFTNRLDGIGADVTTTLTQTDDALSAATRAFDSADAALISAQSAIEAAEATFRQSETLLREQGPLIADQVSRTVERADRAIDDLHRRAARLLDETTDTAPLLTARLTELEGTLQEASRAFTAVTDAAHSVDTLAGGDGALLVAEARGALAQARGSLGAIDRVMEEDFPAIVADLRGGVAVASDAVERLAGDMTRFTDGLQPLTGQAEETLSAATQLFERARVSLDALDGSLAAAGTALTSAESAFEATRGVMQTDLGPLLADISATAGRINVASERVAEDLPQITADLRALIARADGMVGDMQRAVAASAPGLSDFARTGLPELTRLGTEARGLVAALGALVRRIEREPARFLLDGRVPEYRR